MELDDHGQALILTRGEHCDGVWITSLVTALRAIRMQCSVLDVEDAMAASMLPAKPGQVVVNRVSDAAPLMEAKKCSATLRGIAFIDVHHTGSC